MDNFIAEIRPFAGNYAPENDGWLPCDGRLLQINSYQALYALLGTTFGGDGVNTFGIPDLRSRLPVDAGQGAGLSNYVRGATGGHESVTLSIANLPPHNHGFVVSTTAATTNTPAGNLFANPSPNGFYATTPSAGSAAQVLKADSIPPSSGGGVPIDNRMPTLAITYIIATIGIYPEQS